MVTLNLTEEEAEVLTGTLAGEIEDLENTGLDDRAETLENIFQKVCNAR